jgi:hypothetical protein
MATSVQFVPPARVQEGPVLEDLIALLEEIASGRSPDRSVAVRYNELRSAVLASDLRGQLPPFLIQCVSVFRFQEFMGLLAPDRERRIAFLEQAFSGCRDGFARPRRRDFFDD